MMNVESYIRFSDFGIIRCDICHKTEQVTGVKDSTQRYADFVQNHLSCSKKPGLKQANQMTIRDVFAGQFAAVLMTNQNWAPEEVAKRAIQAADALIERLSSPHYDVRHVEKLSLPELESP